MPLTESLRRFVEENCLSQPVKQECGLKTVIDTNVILDLVFWHDEKAADLARLLESGRLTAVRDRESMMELAEVTARDRFLGSESAAGECVRHWCARAWPVDEAQIEEIGKTLRVRCRDPLDQKFLTLAVASRAVFLVSKDKLVLKAGKKLRRFGILTVKPEALQSTLESLENQTAE